VIFAIAGRLWGGRQLRNVDHGQAVILLTSQAPAPAELHDRGATQRRLAGGARRRASASGGGAYNFIPGPRRGDRPRGGFLCSRWAMQY
jgi:hypothetical protein